MRVTAERSNSMDANDLYSIAFLLLVEDPDEHFWKILTEDTQHAILKLANTSIQDLQSSLNFVDDILVLRLALTICRWRGEKTKTAMLERKLKKLETEEK